MIGNNGQSISSTNYWDSEPAKSGFCFLSWNANAARLLVPDTFESAISEMRSAKYVIVSRGPWPEQSRREALELLFEDESDSPYCMTLCPEQTDRVLPKKDQGGGFVFSVWMRTGEMLRLPGKYRVVKTIPCLAPWRGH
jgi:hypothetical protein